MSKKLGKVDQQLFEGFIQNKCGAKRSEVTVKPGFGVDVSIINLPGNLEMALTSDPLSLIPTLGLKESAWLSVHLMANDMATTGQPAAYGQVVLNLPADFSQEDFAVYWNYIHEFCEELGIAITGGHTGFIEGQNSTIAGGGTLVTVAPKGKLLTTKNAKPGDIVMVTKHCAITSAAILAMSFPETIKNKLGAKQHQEACDSFYQTSSVQDAMVAVDDENHGVTAMHDVTEGGVLGAIYELAKASGNGVIVDDEKIPIGELQNQVCRIFDLDPRYCIGAGSMIITCKPEKAAAIRSRLNQAGIDCTQVGQLVDETKGILLEKNGQREAMNYYEEDPYWAAFFKALNAGWK